jgi:hypothetical protein
MAGLKFMPLSRWKEVWIELSGVEYTHKLNTTGCFEHKLRPLELRNGHRNCIELCDESFVSPPEALQGWLPIWSRWDATLD